MHAGTGDISISQPGADVGPMAARVLGFFDRWRRWLMGLVIAMNLLAFSGQWRPGPDSAVFLTVGRNLARGEGFTYQGEVRRNINPGLPTLISWSERVFGEDVHWPILVFMLACGLATLAIIYRLMRIHADRPTAVLVTCLLGVNVTFFRHNLEILADTPLALGCALAFWGVERLVRPRERTLSVARVGVSAGMIVAGMALMMSMKLGVVAPAAGLLAQASVRAVRSRYRWWLIAGVLAALGAALAVRLSDPRMASGLALLPKEREIIDRLGSPAHVWSQLTSVSGPELLTRVTPAAIFGNRTGIVPIDVMVSLGVLGAGILLVRRRVMWGVTVLALCVQWAVLFADVRYFLPVLGVMILGVWRLLARLELLLGAARAGGAVVVVGMVLLTIAPGARDWKFIAEQRLGGFEARYDKGKYDGVERLGSAMATQLPPGVVVIAPEQIAPVLHYWSQRRVVLPEQAGDVDPRGAGVCVMDPGEGPISAMLTSRGWGVGEVLVRVPKLGGGERVLVRVAPAGSP